MTQSKKQLLVGGIGFLSACAGMLLRVNAKALSMHSYTPAKLIGPGGKPITGAMSFSFENTARTAALTDIGMVLVYVGAALIVVAIGAWLFTPTPSHEAVNQFSTDAARSSVFQRVRTMFRWPIWKREPESASVFRS
jgi:hypothetical protein